MTMVTFEPMDHPGKLNIALWGPSGAGKTYTGLAIAHQLGSRVAVIDTEHRASSLYTRRFPAAIAELLPPYHPERFLETIEAAAQAGYDVVLIDSLSPEWDGPGGCLDQVAQARSKGTKPPQAWAAVTPQHDALLGAINRLPISVIVTFREKPRLVLTTGDGKTQFEEGDPTPVTRERFEYEYDLVLHINAQHVVHAVKSRLFAVPEGGRMPADQSLLNAVHAAMAPAEVPS